jgi:putative salt-induced outer membrane protein YdiY
VRRLSVAALLGVLAIASAEAQTAGRATADAPQLRRLERALFDALHGRDRAQLERLLADEFVLRGTPDIDRATWLQNATTLCWGDRSDLDAFRVRPYGEMAIASFELTFYVDPSTCRPAVLRSLVTDVWVRDTGGWRLHVRHAGAPPQPDADIAAQYGIVPQPPPAWAVSGELSFVATGGNTSTQTLGLGARGRHRTETMSTDGSVAFLDSEADSVTNARSLTLDVQHGVAIADGVQLFGHASYARNEFAGIDHRATVTTGVAYEVSPKPSHSLKLQGGIGVTVERRVDATRLRFATATGAVNYEWSIAPDTKLVEESAINADLQSGSNWRASNTLTVNVTLTRILSLKASHAIEYRHEPVAGFGRSDHRGAIALVVSMEQRPKLP